jgi:uncharacterized protein YgiM (DUF1202 family)
MNEPRDSEQNGSQPLPLAIIVPLVVVLAVIIGVVAFSLSGGANLKHRTSRDDPERLTPLSTLTPSPTPPSTSTPTPIRRATATRAATARPTRTPRSSPTATSTATATDAPTAAATETATLPPPTATPHAVVSGDEVALRAGPMQKYDVVATAAQGDALPVVGRSGDGRWLQVRYDGELVWVLATALEAVDAVEELPVVRRPNWPPTPTPRPTRTPRTTRAPRIPRPVLLEPRGGARFGRQSQVRFKFSWYRRLEPDERVALYVRTADRTQVFDWWASEADILGGGGAIHEEEDRVVYEINSGVGALPGRSVYWRVAIFLDTPEEQTQVSPWSRERRIALR